MRQSQQTIDGKGYLVEQYDSVQELVDLADQGRRQGWGKVVGEDLGAAWRDREWYGRDMGGSWEGAVAAAKGPWQEGLELVEQASQELQQDAQELRPRSRRRRARWSPDSGDEICMDRLRSGQDYWRETSREVRDGSPVVTLVVETNGLSGVRAEAMLWRGVVGCALTDLLEQAGYRVQLVVVYKSRGVYTSGLGGWHQCTAKEAGDPADVATLVNVVSGWFFRAVTFQRKGATQGHRAATGLGASCSVSLEDSPLQELVEAPGRTYLVGRVWDREAALEQAREILRDLAGA